MTRRDALYNRVMPSRAPAPMMRLSRPDTRLKFYLSQLETASSDDARRILQEKIAVAEKQCNEPFRRTARDTAILEFLARVGSADLHQITRHVGGSMRGVRHRAKLMFRKGLIARPQNQYATLAAFSDEGNHALVYGLTRQGARLLTELGKPVNTKLDYTGRNSVLMPLTLAHSIAVTEAMLAFDIASREKGLHLIDQHELPLPLSSRARYGNPFACKVTVQLDELKKPIEITNVPDRVFSQLFPDDSRSNYFLERDRGTMDIWAKRLIGKSSFRKKHIGYFHFWKQGLHTQRFAFTRFRVLTITTSEQRIRNMIATQREVTNDTAAGLFLYTTPERITKQGALGPAWISAERDNISLLERKDTA
jgi:Replication-relaxation